MARWREKARKRDEQVSIHTRYHRRFAVPRAITMVAVVLVLWGMAVIEFYRRENWLAFGAAFVLLFGSAATVFAITRKQRSRRRGGRGRA